MMSVPYKNVKIDVMPTRSVTIPALDGQTDGRTDLLKQYRDLHASHADARKKLPNCLFLKGEIDYCKPTGNI